VVALANARHNIRMNRVARQIELACADLSALPEARFDLVVANLVLDPLRDGMSSLARACRPGADVFLSGLLAGQGESLVAVAERLGLSLVSIRRQEEWQLLHLRASLSVLSLQETR
jgi:ribosomal protein L11 methyltransferase